MGTGFMGGNMKKWMSGTMYIVDAVVLSLIATALAIYFMDDEMSEFIIYRQDFVQFIILMVVCRIWRSR